MDAPGRIWVWPDDIEDGIPLCAFPEDWPDWKFRQSGEDKPQGHVVYIREDVAERLRAELAAANASIAELETAMGAAKVLLAQTPNPVYDMLKPVLMGEIREKWRGIDEFGDEVTNERFVPWDTIKVVIRAALRAIAEE